MFNNCCCNTQKAIIEQGYQNQLANERQTYQITNSVDSVERAEDSAYATQTCALQNTIRDTANTNQIIAKLDAMQNQALLDKIDALREKNSQQLLIMPSRLLHLDK